MSNVQTLKEGQTTIISNYQPPKEVEPLTKLMINELIAKVEKSVHSLSQQIEYRAPALREAEELYFPLRDEHKMYSDAIIQERKTLEALIGLRDNKDYRSEIKVYNSISNTKDRKKGVKRFAFLAEAISVLEISQRFLSEDSLMFKIFDKNPKWKDSLFTNGKEKQEKKKIIHNFMLNVTGKNTKKPKLAIYNNKFGLKEWMQDESTPNVKYILL